MALSRIWSAFIIIAVLVAASKAVFSGDNQIFSNMVVGKADDAYDSVRYIMIGSPASPALHQTKHLENTLQHLWLCSC